MAGRIVPPAGPPRALALAQLADSIGLGVFLVCSALYFSRIVGLSPTQIGLGLTVGWGVGLVAGVPLGHLADRRGPRGTAVFLAIGTGTVVGSFLFVQDFLWFLVVACLYAGLQCGLAAARQALLAALVDQAKRTEIRAYQQSALNAGLAFGAVIGGVALQIDTRAAYLTAFAIDAVSLFAAAVLLHRLPALTPVADSRRSGEPALVVLRDRPYALISFLNMIMQLHIPMIGVAIPLWVVHRTEAPRWVVSALLMLNTLAVVLFQVRLARRVTGPATAVRSMRQAGAVLFVACAVFALSGAGESAWLAAIILLAAAGLQVVGEMTQAAGAWEVSFSLAPSHRHGQYQGFFGSGFAVARMLGPLLLTTLTVTWGTPGWLLLGGLFLLAGILMAPAVRWAERTRPHLVQSHPAG